MSRMPCSPSAPTLSQALYVCQRMNRSAQCSGVEDLSLTHLLFISCISFVLVYFAGHAKARLVQMLPHGTRVCLTATLLDGLVLALVAFHHSMNYRSAVLHGEVEEIDDDTDGGEDGERWEAARQVVEKVLPGRWDDARQPTKAEMKATGFIKVRVLTARWVRGKGKPS